MGIRDNARRWLQHKILGPVRGRLQAAADRATAGRWRKNVRGAVAGAAVAAALASASSSAAAKRLEGFLAGEAAGPDDRFANLQWWGDPHPSQILREHSTPGQPLGSLWRELPEKDGALAGILEKRVDAVVCLPRRILPPSKHATVPLAHEIATFCREAVARIPNFDLTLRHQWQATIEGLAVDELFWEIPKFGPLAGRLVLREIRDRPMDRFGFVRGQLGVRKRDGAGRLDLSHHPAKFLVWRRGTHDSPWGYGLMERLFWVTKIKQEVMKAAAIAAERWGSPIAKGTYPAGNTAQERKLLELLETLQAEGALALPKGVEIELMEATRGGSMNYNGLIDLFTRAQALIVLGEVDTSGAGAQPGSYAKARVGNEVRREKVANDAAALSAHLKDNFLRPLVLFNYGPDCLHLTPQFRIEARAIDDPELRREGIEAVLAEGLGVPEEDYYEVMGVRQPSPGERVVRRQELREAA